MGSEKYRYNKSAGALNEAAEQAPLPNAMVRRREVSQMQSLAVQSLSSEEDYAGAHNTAVTGLAVGAAPVHAQTRGTRAAPARVPDGDGRDPVQLRGWRSMFYYTVAEGERVLALDDEGRGEILVGPKRVWAGGRRFTRLEHYVAHPGEFLVVRYRDGKQEHLEGPSELWKDPRVHQDVSREEALQIATKEAVVVYAREEEKGSVTRRVEYGPATFVPEPGEWLHTFSWHGSKGGQKVPNALVFQKLWMLPDQMYHDVPDVRTADDAVLTIRLMLFFELVDVETMLSTTHDPIGDFVNAATSDVVDFTGKHDFESFKKHTERLNDLATYKQLTARASQCGYRINKIVYRGYGAPESLQRMHDEAIEQRTRLQLERATQQQAQELEDFKLERQHARAGRQRQEREAEVAQELALARKTQEAELEREKARRLFEREQRLAEEQQRAAEKERSLSRERAHLDALKALGVDLTALLTQGRADQVIELRGGESSRPHLHLPPGGKQG